MLKLSPGILTAVLFSLMAATQVVGVPTQAGILPRAEPTADPDRDAQRAKYGDAAPKIKLEGNRVRIVAHKAMPIIVPKGGKPEEAGVNSLDIELDKDGRVKPESTFGLKLRWESSGAGGKYAPTQIVHCEVTESVPGHGVASLTPWGEHAAQALFFVDDDSHYLMPCGNQNGITIVCGIDGDTKNPKADCRPKTWDA